MYNLSWTSPLLEKDNSKINPVYNTKNYECSQYRKKKMDLYDQGVNYNKIFCMGSFKCYVTLTGCMWEVVKFSGNKRYKGVRCNIISVMRGWVGVQFPEKKRYVSLEWPLSSEFNPLNHEKTGSRFPHPGFTAKKIQKNLFSNFLAR